MKRLSLLLLLVLFSCTKDPVMYDVTVSASEGGTVSPQSGSFEEGSSVTFTATPSAEYLFTKWSNGSTQNPLVLTVTSDLTLQATFTKKQYELTISKEGEGTISEKVINTGKGYDSGTKVELTAVPAGEWVFAGWYGDVTSNDNPLQVTISSPKNIKAKFVKRKYPLTVNIEGQGTVTEEIVNTGRTTEYDSGTTVRLTAQASEGWEFIGWTGDIASNTNPVQLNVSSSKSVISKFVKLAQLESPSGFRIEKQEYKLVLSWNYNPDRRIDSIIVYRGKSINDLHPFISLTGLETKFEDKSVGVRVRYFYKIAYKSNENLFPFSTIVSELPIEPTNTNTPVNNEIGGIHYAYWDFSKPTFEKINHKFTIYEEPTNEDGSLNGDGLYYQFYQGVVNDTIGFYYGIQTRLYKPGVGIKKGLIFSRWGTRDLSNLSNSTNSWGESAGYEGDFIGLREHYEWKVGSYETIIKKDSTDSVGDWYSLHIKNLQENITEYIGSIRFETSSKSSGIKSGGITWSELYTKVSNSPAPNWHLSIDNIIADDIHKPYRVYTTYNDLKFVGFTNIFSTNNKDVHFLMGPKVKRINSSGYLWSN